jgi:hypothetical protein
MDDPAEGSLVSGAETIETSAEYSVRHVCPFVSRFFAGRRDCRPVAAQVTFFPLSSQITGLFQLLEGVLGDGRSAVTDVQLTT